MMEAYLEGFWVVWPIACKFAGMITAGVVVAGLASAIVYAAVSLADFFGISSA